MRPSPACTPEKREAPGLCPGASKTERRSRIQERQVIGVGSLLAGDSYLEIASKLASYKFA
jgi:hypothetical protein